MNTTHPPVKRVFTMTLVFCFSLFWGQIGHSKPRLLGLKPIPKARIIQKLPRQKSSRSVATTQSLIQLSTSSRKNEAGKYLEHAFDLMADRSWREDHGKTAYFIRQLSPSPDRVAVDPLTSNPGAGMSFTVGAKTNKSQYRFGGYTCKFDRPIELNEPYLQFITVDLSYNISQTGNRKLFLLLRDDSTGSNPHQLQITPKSTSNREVTYSIPVNTLKNLSLSKLTKISVWLELHPNAGARQLSTIVNINNLRVRKVFAPQRACYASAKDIRNARGYLNIDDFDGQNMVRGDFRWKDLDRSNNASPFGFTIGDYRNTLMKYRIRSTDSQSRVDRDFSSPLCLKNFSHLYFNFQYKASTDAEIRVILREAKGVRSWRSGWIPVSHEHYKDFKQPWTRMKIELPPKPRSARPFNEGQNASRNSGSATKSFHDWAHKVGRITFEVRHRSLFAEMFIDKIGAMTPQNRVVYVETHDQDGINPKQSLRHLAPVNLNDEIIALASKIRELTKEIRDLYKSYRNTYIRRTKSGKATIYEILVDKYYLGRFLRIHGSASIAFSMRKLEHIVKKLAEIKGKPTFDPQIDVEIEYLKKLLLTLEVDHQLFLESTVVAEANLIAFDNKGGITTLNRYKQLSAAVEKLIHLLKKLLEELENHADVEQGGAADGTGALLSRGSAVGVLQPPAAIPPNDIRPLIPPGTSATPGIPLEVQTHEWLKYVIQEVFDNFVGRDAQAAADLSALNDLTSVAAAAADSGTQAGEARAMLIRIQRGEFDDLNNVRFEELVAVISRAEIASERNNPLLQDWQQLVIAMIERIDDEETLRDFLFELRGRGFPVESDAYIRDARSDRRDFFRRRSERNQQDHNTHGMHDPRFPDDQQPGTRR